MWPVVIIIPPLQCEIVAYYTNCPTEGDKAYPTGYSPMGGRDVVRPLSAVMKEVCVRETSVGYA